VFGNLFRKKSRKPSKDEEPGQDEEVEDIKILTTTSVVPERKDDRLHDDWSAATQSRRIENEQSAASALLARSEVPYRDDKHTDPNPPKESVMALWSNATLTSFQDIQLDTPPATPDVGVNRHTSPETTNASSSIATPPLPWSDSSIHSFLDNDTSIRDALVLVYEGSRLKKRNGEESINPQIADLYGACALHIDEMCSVRDPFYFSRAIELTGVFTAFGRRLDVLHVWR
jgi:hypothetical protein